MEDSFEKLSLEGILSKSRIDVNDTVIDPVVDGDTSESPSSGPRGRKGFLDLPGGKSRQNASPACTVTPARRDSLTNSQT